MESIQADVYTMSADLVKPVLIGLARSRADLLTAEMEEAIRLLEAWDNECEVDRVGPTIYYKWLRFMAKRVIAPHLPADAAEFSGIPEIILGLLARPAGRASVNWFDDPTTQERETPEAVTVAALADALAELTKQFGPQMSEWQWGEIHRLTINHPQFPDLSLGPFPRRGGAHTVDHAHAGLLGERFDTGGGPSLRFRAEVAPGAIRAFNVIPGGQSGDPNSAHYKDQLPLWLQNHSRPMPFYAEELARDQESVLTLLPGPSQ